MTRRAFITGITGQDGSYLAELLLKKGYDVHGMVRRTSAFSRDRIDPSRDRLQLHYGDMTDAASLTSLLREIEPQEIYNLASQSQVGVSFKNPVYTFEVDGLGALQLFEAARLMKKPPKVFQAGSAEMFGRGRKGRLKETDDFRPYSPYGCAKLFAHWQAVNFREGFDLFICNGILFNHESSRRAENFVTRKVTRAAARIKLGLQRKVALGNLDARRDWAAAQDVVQAMWAMLQLKQPGDFVIATGKSHSVRDLCREAFGAVGLDWKRHVTTEARMQRALDPEDLVGDASKARRMLRWKPSTDFRTLVRGMVDEDLRLAEQEAAHE